MHRRCKESHTAKSVPRGAVKMEKSMKNKLMAQNIAEYKSWIKELKLRYRNAQIKASVAVNGELLQYYWHLGEDIEKNSFSNIYGTSFFEKLSFDLKTVLDGAEGFSPVNLRYAHRFYLLYSPIFQQLVEESKKTEILDCLKTVPWGHHQRIIDKCKGESKKALFYVRKTIENHWSRNVLLNFLDTNLYEREGKAVTNFASLLPSPQGELAQQMTKDPYSFNFLAMREKYEEKELKDALIANIEKFLLELGKGFAYMGREYRLQVGETEQFLDMLFYNTNLRCYVVIEIKTGVFDSSNIGQLGTYVAAVNHILKTANDNPTLGLLICKSKDNVLAQFALESSSEPLAISEYELSKLYPENFKSSMPTIEEIESGIQGLFESSSGETS